jgi:tRNA1(Val) A37 N6-methylase TrmN6
LDGLLNRRLEIEQPKYGYRIAMDTVMLAAAVPDIATDGTALEFGCGVGGASLCLSWRMPCLHITGIEVQPELVELAQRNVARNLEFKNIQQEIVIVEQDVMVLPDKFKNGFDHVLMNPPYHDDARHDVSDLVNRRIANSEKEGDLGRWIASAAMSLKDNCCLTLIHRADRKDDILGLLNSCFGGFDIVMLLPRTGQPAKRVIIRAFKGKISGVARVSELILHRADGGYSEAAESILRHGKSLDFVLS